MGASAGIVLAANLAAAEDRKVEWPPKLPPVRIHTVYIGRTGGIYLSRPTEEIDKVNMYLAGVEKKLGDITFAQE